MDITGNKREGKGANKIMKNKWISIKDEKPSIGETVMGYNVDEEVFYGAIFYSDPDDGGDGKWYDGNSVENSGYDKPPTHWCGLEGLPEFPKK